MGEIVGQKRVTKEISRVFDIFITSEGSVRPHFILTGQSGCGKSHIIKSLAEEKELSFIEINAAQITKEGTSGNSLSKALTPLLNYRNRLTIVFCDEFDKLFISDNSNNSFANSATIGVQNEFLKVLESDTASVYSDYGKYCNADVSKTLFVFAGAFNNEPDIDLDKLRSYGIKTEFLGRVGLVYNLDKLTLEDLYLILDHSPLLDSYLKIFQGVDRAQVVETIRFYLKKNYALNDLGARMVNTLIHQYFIKGGELEEKEVKTVTFQKKLSLK